MVDLEVHEAAPQYTRADCAARMVAPTLRMEATAPPGGQEAKESEPLYATSDSPHSLREVAAEHRILTICA